MAKPCKRCGQWVESLPDGTEYNDDGTWHKDTCRPDPEFIRKERIRKAEWEAKNLIKEDSRREDRGYRPIFPRGGRKG